MAEGTSDRRPTPQPGAGARSPAPHSRGRGFLEDAAGDVRHAARQLRRVPGFAALALLTFALGTGLTTATWTLVDHALVRPLPFPAPERLVALTSIDSTGRSIGAVSQANWADWQERNRTLAATAAFSGRTVTVQTRDDAYRVSAAAVIGPLFDVLGAPMLRGRSFTPAEQEDGAAVAVVTESFWRRSLGADPSLATPVVIDGRQYDVVGVVPDGRGHPAGAAIWLGARADRRGGDARNFIGWGAVARLAEDVSIEQARADLDGVAAGIRAGDPEALYSWGVGVVPLREHIVGGAARSLALLGGGVGFILLIACANLAGLGIARAATRLREIAVRRALGAGRWRVLRQLATEYFVLSIAGGAIGFLIAWACIRIVVSRYSALIPRSGDISLDARVLSIAIAATLLTGLFAALVPARQAWAASLRELLGGPAAGPWGRNRTGAVLVALELALAMLLLTGGALLVRSFQTLVGRELGYVSENVITAEVALSGVTHSDAAARRELWTRVLESARMLPGASDAALSNVIPNGGGAFGGVELADRPGERAAAGYRIVSDEAFRVIGVEVEDGRTFDPRDDATSERVAVVNRVFADRFWPGEDPIGKHIRAITMERAIEGGPPLLRVIGVVSNIRHWGHAIDPNPEMFVSYRQVPGGLGMNVLVRTSPAAMGQVGEALRRDLRALDPTLAPVIAPLAERVGAMLDQRRFTMSLLTAFAIIALVLAAVGVYGLISFAVSRRRFEIGVRGALGGSRRSMVGLVFRDAMSIVIVGAVAGLLGAFWLTRLMQGMLFEISPLDPAAFFAALGLLLAAAALAALVPAWRAAAVDPIVVLRND